MLRRTFLAVLGAIAAACRLPDPVRAPEIGPLDLVLADEVSERDAAAGLADARSV